MALLLAPSNCCCLCCGHLQERIPDEQRLVCPVCHTVLIEPLVGGQADGGDELDFVSPLAIARISGNCPF